MVKTIKRFVSGIVIVDKPEGISSNHCLQLTKRLFQAKKAGHTGSLDLLATGVLPICLGEATKFTHYLLEADKQYRVHVRLGACTETGDAEGTVIEQKPVCLNLSQIDAVLAQFTGNIEQVPPMYSALKHEGQPLYKLAREGKTIERPARSVKIHQLQRIEYAQDTLVLDVLCSKGTYIRTLAEDIGKALGCGAYVLHLRRVQAGHYHLDDSYTLEQLSDYLDQGGHSALDDCLAPMQSIVKAYPRVTVTQTASAALQQGQSVACSDPVQGLVQLYEQAQPEIFLGMGERLSDERLVPRRLVRHEC